MAPHTLSPLISPRRLIAILGVSSATLWRMRGRGDLPAPIRISPGRCGWPEAEIAEWLEARRDARG